MHKRSTTSCRVFYAGSLPPQKTAGEKLRAFKTSRVLAVASSGSSTGGGHV